jgi:anaerobic selenocysteine-containing dehydrogenase
MAHKRNIDRLPIIPANAKKQNVVCHYCIVGCGYHAYTWPVNQQGGTAPGANAFGVDLSKPHGAETEAWYSPSMYNIVKQNGEDVHIVIKPDKGCVVNSGLGSIRGARIADDGKARFMDAPWRGLQAPGKEEQKSKFPDLINNGRANHVWQSAYLDVDNDLVMDRWPYPFIEMNPEDMSELDVKEGDLVEVFNDDGSTQAMVYPTPTARKGETFMLFAYPTGVQGNVINGKGVNELVIPNYKQTWASIRKLSDAPGSVNHVSFKWKEYAS